MLPIKLVLDYEVPSLNKLFGMTHWDRMDEKKRAARALLSALQAAAPDSSTPTTLSAEQSTLLTACATLASYLTIGHRTSSSSSGRSS